MRPHPEAIGQWPEKSRLSGIAHALIELQRLAPADNVTFYNMAPEPQRFPIREYGANVHARGLGGDGERRGTRHGAPDAIDEQDCPNRSAFIDQLLKRKRV